MGIELPWHNYRTTDENQGDLPWLDPFSAAEAQPTIVPYISSTSHNHLNQLEAGIGTHTRPPDSDLNSPVMPNDAVLTDTPPVYSAKTDLTGRQGDIDSTTAAQKSDAARLVAAVLTRAVLVVSRLTAPELAGQGISGAATQPCDHDDAELAESDDCEKPSLHRFVDQAAGRMNERNDRDDLAVHTTLSAGGSHISSTSSSSNDYQVSCSRDSAHSLDQIGSKHLSLHQVGSTERCVDSSSKCDDRNFGDNESLPGRDCLEMEESFYGSKSTSNSEEESTLEICGDGTVQSVDREQLKVDTAKANQIDDQISSDICPRSLRSIVSEHLSLHQVASAAQGVLTVVMSSNCDESRPGEASIVVNESTKPHNSEEDNTVPSAKDEELSVASGDKCDKPNDCDNHSTGGAEMENGHDLVENSMPPEQASLVVEESQSTDDLGAEEGKQLTGDAAPEHLSASIDSSIQSDTDDRDFGEEGASLEAEESFYSSKSSNNEEQSTPDFHNSSTIQTTEGEQLSLQHDSASAAPCSDSEIGAEKPPEGDATLEASHPIPDGGDSVDLPRQCANCDDHSADDLEAVNDLHLSENKPPPEEASLVGEESFYSSKSSNDEEQSPSVIQVNSIVQSTDCKQLSVASADQCAGGHSTDKSGTGKQLPGGAVLEPHCSVSVDNDDRINDSESAPPPGLEDASLEVNNSRTSRIVDYDTSSDYFHSSIQSMDKHVSLHQVTSSAECVHTASMSSNYSRKFRTGDVSPEDGSSKQTNEGESSQSTNHKNLSPQPVAFTASLMSDESGRFDGPMCTTCDVDEIITASLDFKQMVYDSRSSISRLRHIFTDYNLAEYKTLIKDCSLEVNVSSHGLKTSKSDSSCITGHSKLRDNSVSRRASTPSICSEPRLNTTDNPSSSDFCLYIARSSAYERRRAKLTAHNISTSVLQSPHKLASSDQLMQSSSLTLKSTNSAACSNEHVCVVMEDADYFTALSSQCSSEQAAGSEDIHTSPMMPPAPEIGIIMAPCAYSSPNPSGCHDYGVYQSATSNMNRTSHYNDCNTSVDKPLPGDVLLELSFESCVDKMSPLPREASPVLNCDSDDGNFQDSSLTIGSGHQGLHQAASSNHPFFSVEAASYKISADYSSSDSQQRCSYRFDSNDEYANLQQVEATVQRLPRSSDHQLSPVGSVVSTENETRVIMDLDKVELPHSRYYDDQELLDVDINSRLTITANSSTDYYSAASEMSSHDSGNHLSPVSSVLSTEDEVRIIMELEESANDGNSMLKMSSSTSLFIPRGLSNAQWKSSSSLASHSDQRNDSTTTFHSILMQLSGSSAGEEDKEQKSNDAQLPQPFYEPY
jgi:hypothetical protein